MKKYKLTLKNLKIECPFECDDGRVDCDCAGITFSRGREDVIFVYKGEHTMRLLWETPFGRASYQNMMHRAKSEFDSLEAGRYCHSVVD